MINCTSDRVIVDSWRQSGIESHLMQFQTNAAVAEEQRLKETSHPGYEIDRPVLVDAFPPNLTMQFEN